LGSGGILAFTNWLLNYRVLGLVSNVRVIDCVRLTAFSQSDNCYLSLFRVQLTTILFLIGSGGILAFTNWLLNYRVLDLIFMFLIVWYYCTLTIRQPVSLLFSAVS
jgi:hypothetical protein